MAPVATLHASTCHHFLYFTDNTNVPATSTFDPQSVTIPTETMKFSLSMKSGHVIMERLKDTTDDGQVGIKLNCPLNLLIKLEKL